MSISHGLSHDVCVVQPSNESMSALRHDICRECSSVSLSPTVATCWWLGCGQDASCPGSLSHFQLGRPIFEPLGPPAQLPALTLVAPLPARRCAGTMPPPTSSLFSRGRGWTTKTAGKMKRTCACLYVARWPTRLPLVGDGALHALGRAPVGSSVGHVLQLPGTVMT